MQARIMLLLKILFFAILVLPQPTIVGVAYHKSTTYQPTTHKQNKN